MPEVLEFVGLFRLLARVWAFAVGAETLMENMLGRKHSRAIPLHRRRRRNAPDPLGFPLGTSAILPPALNSSLSVCYVDPRPLFSRTGPFHPSCVSGTPGAIPSLLLPPHCRYPAGEVWARADLSGDQPTLAAQSHCPFFYS